MAKKQALRELQSRLAEPLVANQIEISLLHTAPLFDGSLDLAQRRRMLARKRPTGRGQSLQALLVEIGRGRTELRLTLRPLLRRLGTRGHEIRQIPVQPHALKRPVEDLLADPAVLRGAP